MNDSGYAIGDNTLGAWGDERGGAAPAEMGDSSSPMVKSGRLAPEYCEYCELPGPRKLSTIGAFREPVLVVVHGVVGAAS